MRPDYRWAFVAVATTNRSGCKHPRVLDRCGHKHRTRETTERCVRSKQKAEDKPRTWRIGVVIEDL